jgi:hypothetical protein
MDQSSALEPASRDDLVLRRVDRWSAPLARTRQSPARAFRLAAGLLGLLIGATVFAPLTLRAEPLKINIAFSGLWWSEDQLNGMDPNNPPPKTTRHRLQKWEWTGDQWPPAPDVVDVDVTLSGGAAAAKTTAQISYQYGLGRGRLSPPKQLLATTIDLSPHGDATSLRGPLPLLRDAGKLHPEFVQVTVKVGAQPPATARLPITVGD